MRDNDSVRDNRLQNMNNILGIMAESQIIKTEKTTLNALLTTESSFIRIRMLIFRETMTLLSEIFFIISSFSRTECVCRLL
jgi:hypothetical protein